MNSFLNSMNTSRTAAPSGAARRSAAGSTIARIAREAEEDQSYFSQPDLWKDVESFAQNLQAKKDAYTHSDANRQKAEKDLMDTRNALSFLQQRAEQAQKAGAGSEVLAGLQERYNSLYKKFRTQRLSYAAAYDQSQRSAAEYNQAINDYKAYDSKNQKIYDAWRSRIRDSDMVKKAMERLELDLKYSGGVESDEYRRKKQLLQEEYQYATYFEQEAFLNSADFKEKSAAGLQTYADMRTNAQALAQQEASQKSIWELILENNMKAYGMANDNPAVMAFNQAAQQYREDTSYQEPSDQWSEDQKNMFGYYFATDPTKAYAYAEAVNNEISRSKAQAQKDKIAEMATDNFWSGAGHTVGALATAPLAIADVMDNLAEFAGRGTVTSKDFVTPYDYSQAVVGGISEKLNEYGTIGNDVPVVGGRGLGDLYSMGFSTAQSLLSGATGSLAGTGALTMLQFMGQGAASGVDAGLESGASGKQALVYGLISGAAEGFAEKIGVDNLMKLGSARTFKGFMKNLLKQSSAEGIEETVTSVIDNAADRLVLGENSTFRKAVAEYEQTMSHESAVRLAWTEMIGGIVFDGLSGAISGGLGAGIRTSVANVTDKLFHKNSQEMQDEIKNSSSAAPLTFQEIVQQQATEKLSGKKAVQAGTVELENPTVQLEQATWDQAQRLAAATGRNIRLYEDAETVNGSYDPVTGIIWVNTKGGDVLTQVFSHEMTHSLEEAGAYGKLSEIVLSRMQATGIDLDVAREAKRKQYERQGHALQTAAAVDQELVAEYVSKYLLTDEASIVSLVKQDRTLGQKIKTWIDGILAKLGNKNAQERAFLSKARNLYAKALRQTQGQVSAQAEVAVSPMGESTAENSQSNTIAEAAEGDNFLDNLDAQFAAGEITAEEYDSIRDEYERYQEDQATASERKYSISKTVDNKPFVTVEHDILDGVPKSEWVKTVKENLKQKFPNGVTVGNNEIKINQQSRREMTYSKYMRTMVRANQQVYSDKLRATNHADEVLLAATDWVNEGLHHPRNDQIRDFARGNVLIRVGENDYSAEVIVGTKEDGTMLLYDIINLRSTSIAEKNQARGNTANAPEGLRSRQLAPNNDSIANDDTDVNTQSKEKYSLSEETVSKKDVASDLRAILKRGGNVHELRQYVDGLERTGGKTERQTSESEAERIVKAARSQGIAVEEYLRQNWEQYDQDGQWNADARKALEMEKKSLRKWSLSEDKEVESEAKQILEEAKRQDVFVEDIMQRNLERYKPNGRWSKIAQKARELQFYDSDMIKKLSGMLNGPEITERLSAPQKPDVRSGVPLADFMGQFAYEKAKPWRQGSVVDDETVRQAHKAGYPVIDGVQIVPFVTWVHCTDPYVGENGEVKRRSDGSIRRRDNYGIVTGLGAKGHLLISFNNKGEKADGILPGEQINSEKENVSIAVEYLEPVRGKYQMTQSEWDSLENSMPEDAASMKLTDEEWAEIEKLRDRAEHSEVPNAEEVLPLKREELTAKASVFLRKAEQGLLWTIADRLSVPKLAGREYLQPIIQEMVDEYLEKGSIRQETRQLLFEKAYAKAVVVDAEFYEQYKHIKDHLRNLRVTISDRNKADIADFTDFRKRAFGTLRIVNEGGLPVDAAYQELHSMAPELFPESITHPADQLVRMYDAARSIQVTEKTVQDYYGEDEPEYRKWAQNDFEEALSAVSGKLWEVRRFALDKTAKDAEKAPATEEEAAEAYKELKAARRAYERVAAKNLLSAHDEMQVGRLLRHEIELEHLDPAKDNVKGIATVFEAKQDYEKHSKLIREYKQHLRGKARKEADALLETANDWKDKKVGIAYSRETMERNVFDIIKDKKLAQRVIDKYFTPVHVAEAAATRFKNDYRDRVREMDLSRKVAKGNQVSEAHAVQLLGEAEDNIRMLENARGRIKNRDGKTLSEWQAVVQQLWEENPNLDKGKIEKAVKEFRYIYDALFQKMNQVRVANGYEPVNYRNGYFPHFQPGDSDSILAQFGRALGIDTRIEVLPTTINGLTHTFKPGIQWFGNAQERLGFNTAYDAVEGFDKYIEGVASVIHQTANIQNLRALASQIRYRTSDDGIREQVDAIQERPGLSEEEKQQLIQEVYAHGKFTLSNFVTELDEYTNLLANKKGRYDRSIEAAMGRRAYAVMKAWEARVGANMIAGNLTSALTNFIPLTQAGAQMDRFALLQGMWNTLKAYRADDGIVNQSTFLTNRRGSDPLVQTWAQKASSVLGKPMELIDGFVADSIVRGAYYQNLKKGMSDAEAMAQADAFASSVMADRSKGAMPTLMQARNPLFKAFTQFQLEVNNQFSEVFKDIPRRFKEKGLAALAWVLLKYFLGALLYNELYERLIGRRPALDPIGMLCEAYDDLRTDGFGAAGKNLAVSALEQLPFSSGLTLIGVELDGGRIPASSAVPDLTALLDAATTEGWSAEKRWKEVQDELNKLAYVLPPFGGNQVSKLWKGVKAYIQGGSYNVDAEGNDVLQYPVYKDDPQDAFWSLVKAAFLGKSSLQEAQDWVDSGFDSLGTKQTAAYQDMVAAGVKDRDAFGLIRDLENARETADKKKEAAQRDVLRGSDVSGEGKAIVYYGLMASDKERELMDTLSDLGADAGAIANAMMDLKDAGSKALQKLTAISGAALTDEEKAVLVGSVLGTDLLTESGGLTQYAKFDYAIHNGMNVDEYIEYRTAGADIDKYLELRDAGASIEDAMNAGLALAELKDRVEDPTTVQKWRVVIDSTDDAEKQLISLSAVMTSSQYAKVKAAYGFGVSPEAYVMANEVLPKYDADGNGKYTQAEVTKAISSLDVRSSVKAALWQLITGSSSAKNNPYSPTIGQKVIDAWEKAKAEQDEEGLSFQDEIMRQIMGG